MDIGSKNDMNVETIILWGSKVKNLTPISVMETIDVNQIYLMFFFDVSKSRRKNGNITFNICLYCWI